MNKKKSTIKGGNQLIDGVANEETLKKTMKKISKKGFAHKIQENLQLSKESKESLLAMARIPRELYIRKYGPTIGDRVSHALLISSPNCCIQSISTSSSSS